MAKKEKIKVIREIKKGAKEIKKTEEEDNNSEEKTDDANNDEFQESKFTEFVERSDSVTPTLEASNQTQNAPADLESGLESGGTERQTEQPALDYSATGYSQSYGAGYTEAEYSQEMQIASQIQTQRSWDIANEQQARITAPNELRGIRQNTQSLPDQPMRQQQRDSETRNLSDYTARIETEEKKKLPFERRKRVV